MNRSAAITGPGVFVPASVCAAIRHRLVRDLEAAQRDCIPVAPDVADAIALLDAVGAAWDVRHETSATPDVAKVDPPRFVPVDWVTVKTAATELGISPQATTALLRRGTLRGERQGRAWRVDRASVFDRKDR